MTYNLSNVIKKIVKTHKGIYKITNSFLHVLENLGSFSKEKIPVSLLRRMHVKKYLSNNFYGSSIYSSRLSLTRLSLKKTDPAKYDELMVRLAHQKSYIDFYAKRKREKEAKKEELTIEPIKKAAAGLEKASKILEAFVIKVFFNLKKLLFAVVDDRGKVNYGD